MEKKIKVLLVDDEERFCETTSKLLIKMGFDTTIANTAEMALHLLKQSPRDVIVLDMKMAGMDGHRALNEIKELNSETQVIILTGHGSKYSATRALVRDAFDYLAKPCDIKILASRIQDAYAEKHRGYKTDPKKALNIMTPIDEWMTVPADISIEEAIKKWLHPLEDSESWPKEMKKNTELVLVSDKRGIINGVLTKMDVIRAIRPEYISASESENEDSSRFSSIFWSGFFSNRVTTIAQKKVKEIMSECPPVVSENANLLEVAHLMWTESKRQLLVKDISRIIGIIRYQDIFREIVTVMTTKK